MSSVSRRAAALVRDNNRRTDHRFLHRYYVKIAFSFYYYYYYCKLNTLYGKVVNRGLIRW